MLLLITHYLLLFPREYTNNFAQVLIFYLGRKMMIDLCKFPLCKSSERLTLVSRKFNHPDVKNFLDTYYEGKVDWNILDDKLYEITKCQNCGFIWQRYILNSVGMKKLYCEWISSSQSLAKKQKANIEFYSGYAKQIVYINSLFPAKKPCDISVLDYGAGWGYWGLMAKAHGYQFTGVELSDERVEFARNNSLKMSYNLSELAGHKFDFINSEQSFEHIPNPLENLISLVEFLQPNGVIRISVPNGKNIEDKLNSPNWKAGKDAIHPLEHINCFTPSSLIYLAKKAGLQVLDLGDRVVSKDNYQGIERLKQIEKFIKRIVRKKFLLANKINSTSLHFIKYSA